MIKRNRNIGTSHAEMFQEYGNIIICWSCVTDYIKLRTTEGAFFFLVTLRKHFSQIYSFKLVCDIHVY